MQAVFVELQDEDGDNGDADLSPHQAAGKACMLCGEEAGKVEVGSGSSVPCACSRGHIVCAVCLRQYVLHTHGLQVRSANARPGRLLAGPCS